MARVIPPEDYGLMGMLTLVFAVASASSQLGLGAALIQLEEVSEDQNTTVFCSTLVVGILIMALVYSMSSLVADFFEAPILQDLIRATSVTIFFTAITTVQTSQISRSLNFRTGTLIEVFSSLLSGICGIWLAYKGFGVWSLAGLMIVRSASHAASHWLLVRWRPTGSFKLSILHRLWEFSASMYMSSILHHLTSNLHTVMIGKMLGPQELGLFLRGSGLQNMASGVIATVSQRVAFPFFSKIQSDRDVLVQSLRKQLKVTSLLSSLLMCFLFILAEPTILILFGEVWRGAIPVLKVLCIAGVYLPIDALSSQTIKALNAPRLFFWTEFTKKILLVCLLFTAFQYGIEGFAWALAVSSVASVLLTSLGVSYLTGYKFYNQLQNFVSPQLVVGTLLVLTFVLQEQIGAEGEKGALLHLIAFVVAFITSFLFLRTSLFSDSWELITKSKRSPSVL
ncbi:MAG: lipopolysaccharide biosynthesis protein [Pseudomonadales bacterium]|nr:lipopolysaccharide biosynthesis protein [Pseudomonadales bacterium]MBO6822493.1 lipopolysaccharide biosynthesis protein [Pseudomonadales bacterium]